MEYTVVMGEDRSSLEKGVNEFLSNGWRPQGGVSVAIYTIKHRGRENYDEPGFVFMQALVRDKEPTK